MTSKKAALPALALLAIAAGAAGLSLPPAHQAVAQAAGEQHGRMDQRFMPGRHIEGRIAFLKAELKITAPQEPQWDKLAAVMRENAKEMDRAVEQMRGDRATDQTAVQRLEARTRFAALRAQSSQRFLDAFRPLYDSLAADQKKSADDLLAARWRR